MVMKNDIHRIDALKSVLDAYRPFPDHVVKLCILSDKIAEEIRR